MVKSRNDVKNVCFRHVLCHNSAIFEHIDLKLCTHIHQPLPSNKFYVFSKKKKYFEGENVKNIFF